MDAYSTDAGILCLAAIDAIKKRAIEAGVDPVDSTAAMKAAYVPIWIWNHATERARVPPGRAKGGTSIAVNQRADVWASDVHKRYLHSTSAGSAIPTSPSIQGTATRGVDSVGADVWTNLANALAMQAASRSPTMTGATKGFEAFPITTQQMILFASERDKTGSARSSTVDTYTEILGLTSAAYVAQHLHHHLKTRLRLDVLLPSGFCSAVRMASFISTTNDRPEAFSLFSCGPHSLYKKASTGSPDEAESADDLMRMQLKAADLTTVFSDKDIKKLTLVRHVAPRDFSCAGRIVREYGGRDGIEIRNGGACDLDARFMGPFSHAGGSTVANLRRLAFQDITAPSRLGRFVERRIQQYLTSCASCRHIDAVNATLFDFQAERQHFDDGLFLHLLCPYLKTKLGLADASSVPRSGGGPGRGVALIRQRMQLGIRADASSKSRVAMFGRSSLITPEMRQIPTFAAAII
jgi:hypothetical protein